MTNNHAEATSVAVRADSSAVAPDETSMSQPAQECQAPDTDDDAPSTASAKAAPPSSSLNAMVAEHVRRHQGKNAVTPTTLKVKEIDKQHKRRLKDFQKLINDKKRSPETLLNDLQHTVQGYLNMLVKAERTSYVAQSERDVAVSQVRAQEEQLAKSEQMQTKLQDLCRELQKENKRIQQVHEAEHAAEKKHREETFQQVNATVANISERLTEQQAVIEKQGEENSALRERMVTMNKMVELTEKVNEQYEKERTVLQEELKKQAEMAALAVQRYNDTEAANRQLLEQLEVYSGNHKTAAEAIDLCHKKNLEVMAQNKELTSYNKTLKEQYEKGAKMLLDVVDQSRMKDERLKKLQLANERLQSLARTAMATSKSPKAAEAAPPCELSPGPQTSAPDAGIGSGEGPCQDSPQTVNGLPAQPPTGTEADASSCAGVAAVDDGAACQQPSPAPKLAALAMT